MEATEIFQNVLTDAAVRKTGLSETESVETVLDSKGNPVREIRVVTKVQTDLSDIHASLEDAHKQAARNIMEQQAEEAARQQVEEERFERAKQEAAKKRLDAEAEREIFEGAETDSPSTPTPKKPVEGAFYVKPNSREGEFAKGDKQADGVVDLMEGRSQSKTIDKVVGPNGEMLRRRPSKYEMQQQLQAELEEHRKEVQELEERRERKRLQSLKNDALEQLKEEGTGYTAPHLPGEASSPVPQKPPRLPPQAGASSPPGTPPLPPKRPSCNAPVGSVGSDEGSVGSTPDTTPATSRSSIVVMSLAFATVEQEGPTPDERFPRKAHPADPPLNVPEPPLPWPPAGFEWPVVA
mmetsp:Transcript_26884/g.84250  ORF Transcript_26884/g.84250 Transcript_26884/m.84250 type:complete len:352 (+) Transcript_26884:494-1549(+)